MALNDKAAYFAKKSKLNTFYFNIFDYLDNLNRGQTPFTPATSIVEQLDYRLQKIKEEGLDNYQHRYRCVTNYLRDGMKKLGFEIFAKNPVNCVSGYKSSDYNAADLIYTLQNKYNIEIAPSGGDLRTSFFRVGVYGNIGYKEVDNFLQCLELSMNEYKESVNNAC